METTHSLEQNFLRSYHLIRSTDQDVLSVNMPECNSKVSGLPTLRTTCNAVILKMYELDNSGFGKSFFNEAHWNRYNGSKNFSLGEPYPSHAIINVQDKDTADDVAEYLNLLFNNDRDHYPRSSGWNAIATYGNCKPALSERDHPFFYYKNHGKMNSKASRILVVVDMAGEGLNNRFINVWGAACKMSSVREAVQRIGRTLRSTVNKAGESIRLSPASHDTVYVITHEDFRNGVTSTHETIGRAFDFITNSHSYMADVVTIHDYANTDHEAINDDIDDLSVSLGVWEKVKLAMAVGNCLMNGKNPRAKAIIKEAIGTKIKESKRRYATAWIESAYAKMPTEYDLGIRGDGSEDIRHADAMADLNLMLRDTPPAQLDGVLIGEKLVIDSMDENECIEWLQSKPWGTGLVNSLRESLGDGFVQAVNNMKIEFGEMLTKSNMEIRELPINRINNIVNDLAGNLGKSPDDVREIVMECVTSYFGNVKTAIEEDDFREDGALCKPEITYHLRDPNFGMDVRSFVMWRLINSGKLNALRAILMM